MAQHSSSINISGEPTYLCTEEECYCHFYYDYNYYYDYIAAIAQAQRAAWFESQKGILKGEIEDRMNTTYNTFEAAQYDFFKKRFAKAYADRLLSDTRRVDEVGKSNSYADYSNTYVTRKIFQYAQNNSSYDFKGLTHYNKTIESMTFLEAQNLFNQYNTDNGDFENDWAYHHNRIIRNDWVNNNEQFHDFMANAYVNHVNSFSLEQRVSLMTGYLIYNAQSQNLIYAPPTIFNGISLYLPYNYDYTNTINNLINNANVPWQGISSLNMSFEELRRRYSVMGMHLGNKTANYLKGKDKVLEEAGNYQDRSNFNSTSKNMMKKIVEYYLGDEPFADGDLLKGTSAWGQNDDRPEQLASIRLSNAALSYGFKDFGKVMEAMSEQTTEYALKGELIKRFITKNTSFSFPSSLSVTDLGKIFDFDDRGSYYLGLKFSKYAMDHIIDIEHGDNQYDWDLFLDPFKIQALKSLANGGIVDFRNEIIKDPSFINTKANCVLEILLEQNGYFKTVMNAFTNNNSKYRIKFTTGSVQTGADAQTSPPDSNGIITITLRPESANGRALEIAGILLHEGVHAQLHRVLASGNNSQYNFSTSEYNFLIELNEWWKGQSIMPAQTAQHDFMSLRYVMPIANEVRKFDNYAQPLDNYLYFGWEGLYDEGSNRGLISMSEFNNFTNLAQIPLNDNHTSPCD